MTKGAEQTEEVLRSWPGGLGQFTGNKPEVVYLFNLAVEGQRSAVRL